MGYTVDDMRIDKSYPNSPDVSYSFDTFAAIVVHVFVFTQCVCVCVCVCVWFDGYSQCLWHAVLHVCTV